MPAKKTVRFDHLVLASVGCLIVGYLLGLGTAVLIQQKPVAPPGPSAAAPQAVAPPSSALGSHAAERRELENIVGRDPGNRTAWVRLGNLLFDTAEHLQAIDAYTRALELGPDDPDVITDRGIMYRAIGDFDKAAGEFRRAAEVGPKHLNSLLNLGVVLRYDLNDVPGALQAWKTYLERNPPPDMAEKIRREIQTLQGQ